MSENARIDALELAVARLTKEMVALRTEVRRMALSSPPASAESYTPPEPRGVEGRGEAGGDAVGVAGGGAPGGGGAGGPPRTTTSPPASPDAPSFDPPPPRSSAPGAGGPRQQPYVSDHLRRIAAGIPRGAGAGGAPPRPRSPRPSWSFERGEIERLVGRYGTLALAALTILMGVGAFLGWAVRNGVIGPELRVALGAATAAVVAVVGWRLRTGKSGTSPRFGNILLALSLAIVHVVCWGAGPLLHLVPDVLSLGAAAAASAALAALSLRDEDQSLFNVGFGGALLAPFVTSSGKGDPLLLLLYGAVVLAAGMHAMRDRAWRKTPLVQMAGVAVYTAVTTTQLMRDPLWPRATAPALFALAVAWLSLILVRGAPRSRVAHASLAAALAALAALHNEPSTDWPRALLALVATITGYATSRPEERGMRSTLLGALLFPLASVAVALSTLPAADSASGAVIALVWAAAASAAAWMNRDGERGTHAFTATALGGLAVALPVWDDELQLVLRIAAYGAAASFAMRRARLPGLAAAIVAWLTPGAVVAFSLLADRTPYAYPPFRTEASLAAAAISTAWLIFSWNASRYAFAAMRAADSTPLSILRILGAAVAFFWVHEELAGAFSDDAATFLLIAYYAVTGIVAIGMGRWRSIPVLRQVGLALSVLAALKAIGESSDQEIGWRVGGYMLAGLFLLGVAYWYRASGRREGEGDAAGEGAAA